MKALSVAGTAAMFLVGGGILVHGIPPLHHAVEALAHRAAALPGAGWVVEALGNMVVGVMAGALVLCAVSLVRKVAGRSAAGQAT